MIRTAQDVKDAKKKLGWSVGEIADALRLSSTSGSTTVRAWMSGKREITGPAAVALEAILDGYEPEHMDYDYEDDGDGFYD
jgi:transcriptional regulator with XRE-family HTH domain